MPAAIAELRSHPARSDGRRPSTTTTVLVYAKDPISGPAWPAS